MKYSFTPTGRKQSDACTYALTTAPRCVRASSCPTTSCQTQGSTLLTKLITVPPTLYNLSKKGSQGRNGERLDQDLTGSLIGPLLAVQRKNKYAYQKDALCDKPLALHVMRLLERLRTLVGVAVATKKKGRAGLQRPEKLEELKKKPWKAMLGVGV